MCPTQCIGPILDGIDGLIKVWTPLRSPRTARGLSHPCPHTAFFSVPRGYFRVFEVAMASTHPMPSRRATAATRARPWCCRTPAPFVHFCVRRAAGPGQKKCAREPCAFAGGGRGKMASRRAQCEERAGGPGACKRIGAAASHHPPPPGPPAPKVRSAATAWPASCNHFGMSAS